MDLEKLIEKGKGIEWLGTALGMEFVSTPDPDQCVAYMPVDQRTQQPYGYLSGGASLALAETLAGVGSSALSPDAICVGVAVSGNHIKAVPAGADLKAVATIVGKGHTIHVWRVDIYDPECDLVSTVNVTNYLKRANK